MIFGENLYLPSKLRNEATQTWVENAISSLFNRCIQYMSIRVIIPELKRRAVEKEWCRTKTLWFLFVELFPPSLCFYLMLLHRESNVNRSNDMKSLVGYYVNKPEGAFSSGMKNFLLLETFDSTADLSETCFRWPSCRLIFVHKAERSPKIDWGKKVVYFVERATRAT